MGLFDSIKKIMTIPPEEDEYEEAVEEVDEAAIKKRQPEPVAQKQREPQARVLGGKGKVVNTSINPMEVVLAKPERFDEVTSIADNLNDKKTVILNLESCERDLSRRIMDFLTGAAYANHCNVRKVAVSTFIIVPNNVDVSGETMLDEFDESRLYF